MTEARDSRDPWWKRWFINPIVKQLTQGISADKLAWTIAIGCAAGIFQLWALLLLFVSLPLSTSGSTNP
jgi:hypothetical protein